MIEYEDCVELGNSREDLKFDMTRDEFNDAMKNRGKTVPSQVKLNWQCTNYLRHKWKKGYSAIKIGYSCPDCRYISYEDCVDTGNSREDLEFDMTRDEFNDAMKNRGKKPPSKVKLNWQCTNYLRHKWKKELSLIKLGYGCPHCRQISYEDCVELGHSRDDLELYMTHDEFKDAMKNRGKTPPSRVKLRWRCREDFNHMWLAHYRNIGDGNGCPLCRQTSYEDCLNLGLSRDDLEFYMTRDEFNDAMKNRGNTNPSKVKLRWRCKDNLNHIWRASYNSIQKDKGCPNCAQVYAIKGTHLHMIIRYLITECLIENNEKIYTEVNLSSKTGRRVDALILNFHNSSNFYLRLVKKQKALAIHGLIISNLNKTKAFIFDFTSDLSYDNIKDKATKYQKKDMILFIVGTRWKCKIIDSSRFFKNTIYKNVYVIKYNLFAYLIGLNGIYLEIFNKVINKIKCTSLQNLSKISKILQDLFFKKFGRGLYSNDDLRSDLQNFKYKL